MVKKILIAIIGAAIIWGGLSVYHSQKKEQCLEQNGTWDAQAHECAP